MAQLKASMTGHGPRIAALTNSRHIVSAIAGMGSVGKTTLARTWAWEHQDSYHSVWWIDAEAQGGVLCRTPGLARRRVGVALIPLPVAQRADG
jgi:Mrp family chromosome partitioning ATPase